jgi:magnesium-protoporphyrin IX monomethyl ester (oxidative) cyclase
VNYVVKKVITKTSDVVLVSLPFGPLYIPSLALSLFKASLEQQKISTTVCYFTQQFAQLITEPLYDRISDGEPARADLLGEWIFTDALYGVGHAPEQDYINQVLKGHHRAHSNKKNTSLVSDESLLNAVLAAKAKAPAFIDECVNQVLALNPKVVGISSTFETQIASLAFTKKLKQRSPQTTVVIGGSNCDGIMGKQLSQSFGFIDVVVSGEADVVFPDLVKQLLSGQPATPADGVYLGASNPLIYSTNNHSMTTVPIEDLDSLPYPDFSDFLTTVEEYKHLNTQSSVVHLAVETARGCWWGERKHCTFCEFRV